ncbi:proline-rich protein 36 [Hippoglossus stenolepis]|uniref:proline-rich protein 36 n=1 Tax=Hippoglossus stenolepis TaxID=195615 RepID=UPI001FAEF6A1|nr:proline-rich protein 36 [Hippoglossus stenolepis]
MKKGALHFLGRKNRSLFDTNIQIKDMDNVELVRDTPAIPESGTASVRARPTVKHHASSDTFHGFAVPTPKVPLLPPVNGLKANGSVGEDRLSNGSVISVPDLVEGEIIVPPPPSIAPPPPPGTFIPPPLDFMGDLNSLDLYAQKPTPMASSMEEDLVLLKPPPMAPPKPPSTGSSGSASSILSSPPAKIPEIPNFAPAQPPTEKQHKTYKAPPQKPIRLSSISNFELPPQTPAPPPPEQTPTRSTFNPRNTAKLFTVPQHSILSGYNSPDQIPKQMLLLEDSGSVKSGPVRAQVDGKVSTPTKPVSRDAQAFKENLQTTQPSPPSPPASNQETKQGTVSAQPVVTTPLPTPPRMSPQLLKVNSSETRRDTLEESSSRGRKFSPLLDRKLRNLKSSETNGAREGPAVSPLALLMAAKEREKHRSTHSLSRENSAKKNEQPSTSIYESDSSPNSFVVIPRSSSSSALTSQERIENCLESATKLPEKSSSPAMVRDPMQSTSSALNRLTAAASARATDLVGQKHNREQTPPKTQSAQPVVNQVELSLPLLPPPPEFDDLEEFTAPPPSIPPPEPPKKKPPAPPMSLPPPAPALPPSPKPAPPAAPKLPAPNIDVKPKPQMVPTQPPSSLSPSQATLLSILQKKMLEMDHKMAPTTTAESSSDDWGTPQSDEYNKSPVPRAPLQSKSNTVGKKTASLDMRELESKVAKKYQETSSLKVPTSNGRSKHQYGRTFTVRPGTKQPITPHF